MRRIVMCLSHSIEEYDQLRLLSEIGHEVVSIGGYIDPAHPHDDKRPALSEVPLVSVVKDAVDAIGAPDNLLAAQEHLPDAILDWADTIIYHHYLHRLYGQWPRIKDWLRGDSNRRVIWRTVGQSVDGNEYDAQTYHADGMEIVRYSPKERNIPLYAGEDALIRFYKDPDEWCGWIGSDARVINVTQSLKQRDPWTHWRFWEDATRDLPRIAIGPGSEEIQGSGAVSYEDMQRWLRVGRCMLYMGTQPASYTLGLIEAMMTGIPVVAMGPGGFAAPIFPYVPEMYEAHEITENGTDSAEQARAELHYYLLDHEAAHQDSALMRQRAIDLFGKDKIKAQWAEFLS